MQDDIEKRIVNIMKNDTRREYTVPEIMGALGLKSREKVMAALGRMEGRDTIEKPREKGRAKYYRLK